MRRLQEGKVTPTVSFDLDGVIMQNPFAAGIGPHMRAHIRRGRELLATEPAEADQHIDQAVRECWGERMARGDFVAAYNWDEIYSEVSRRFGGESAPDVAKLVEESCRQDGMIALLPGAKEGLNALQKQGVRMVALTNGYHPYQWPVLEALGIAEFFADVVTPDVTGYAKPDPRLFQSIPDLVAHVGDTLLHDVVGANLAGVTSVWLDADLPEYLRMQPITKRVEAEEFRTYLEERYATAPYREYHPEATLGYAFPNIVVTDMHEAAQVLLDAENLIH
jgi:HAD superfamily hydrolase (TIGR01549 family)